MQRLVFFKPVITGLTTVFVCTIVSLSVIARDEQPNVNESGNSASNSELAKYRFHDIENESKTTRIRWALIKFFLSLYSSDVRYLYGYEKEDICDSYIDSPIEFDIITAFTVGQKEWNPADFELGYTGFVQEIVQEKQERSVGWFLNSGPSDKNWTLKDVCNELKSNTSVVIDDQSFESVKWLVTERPLPNTTWDHIFRTNLNEDKIPSRAFGSDQ